MTEKIPQGNRIDPFDPRTWKRGGEAVRVPEASAQGVIGPDFRRMRGLHGSGVLPNPESALGEDRNFDSGRWQKFKAGALAEEGARLAGKRQEEKADKKRMPFLYRAAKSGKVRSTLAAVAIGGTVGGTAVWAGSDYFGGDSGHVSNELKLSQDEIANLTSTVSDLGTQIAGLNLQITDLQGQIDELRKGLDAPQTPQEQEVTTSRLSGSFTPEQAAEVIDVVGDETQDNKVTIKIVKVEGHSWSTFDWSQAKAFETIGIKNFDPSNPALNGAERWQITTILAESLGVTPQQLNLVYYGDEFKIPITRELVDKLISLNVQVPDNIMSQVGLLDSDLSQSQENDSLAANVNAPSSSSGSGGISNVELPRDVSGSASGASGAEIQQDSHVESLSVAGQEDTGRYIERTYYLEDVTDKDDGTSELVIVPSGALDESYTLPVTRDVAVRVEKISEETDTVFKIDAYRRDNKINYVYRQSDGSEMLLRSELTRAYLQKQLEDQQKVESRRLYEDELWMLYLGAAGISFALGFALFARGAWGRDKDSLLDMAIAYMAAKLRKKDHDDDDEDDDEEAGRIARLARIRAVS